MPRTKAGKRLFDYLCPEASLYAEGYFTEAIDDIEVEAAADERERITREVEEMPESMVPAPSGWGPMSGAVDRAAVLAIVNGEDTDDRA